jgi:hypothetical protein
MMIESDLRSTFEMTCVQPDNELIAWSEYRSRHQNRHLWRCRKCGCCFETIVDTASMEDNAAGDDVFRAITPLAKGAPSLTHLNLSLRSAAGCFFGQHSRV